MDKVIALPQIVVVVRYLMAIGGTFFAARLPEGSWEQLTAAAIALVTVLYAIYANRPAGLAARAAEAPGVIRVVADKAVADAAPSPKVVGPSGF